MRRLKSLVKDAVKQPATSLAVLITLDILLILTLPASQKTLEIYNISASEYKVLLFATAVPSIITWAAAFAAYHTSLNYARALRNSGEGEHFRRLSVGITWLAWGLPLTTISTLILNAASYSWPGFRPTAIVIGNYIGLALVLIAFVIISRAGRDLMDYFKLKYSDYSKWAIVWLFTAAGVSYCYFALRGVSSNGLGDSNNPYFLPLWLMFLTIILPYMYAWFNGFLAAYGISLLSKKISGVLYRRALRYLASGLVIVIITSIALQYINAIQPRVGYLLIDYKFLFTTLIRLSRAAGFLLMAYGAIRLKRIEEV